MKATVNTNRCGMFKGEVVDVCYGDARGRCEVKRNNGTYVHDVPDTILSIQQRGKWYRLSDVQW